MLVESGLLLRQAGLRIRGVISSDPAVVEWAGALQLPAIGHDADVVDWLARSPFDYLLSIFNLAILPVEILRLPRIAAINFHDGPLPRYAGLHASSWGILNDEKRWAVTWHLMEPAIDTGAIVRQRWFDVSADDTALSLNLKGFKAGLDALAEMIPDLSEGTIAATPQDLAGRTYYAGSRRPAAAGVIDWSGRGEQGESLARAVDFGPSFNPLVLPKIWTGEECLIVSRVRLGELAGSAPPGTVLAVDDGALTIATASRPVTVAGLATIDGEPLSVAEAARRFRLHVGRVLPLLGPERIERLTASSEAAARHERYWAERLLSLEPVVPVRVPRAVHAREWVARAWRVPERLAASLGRQSHGCPQGEWLLAAIGAFLARWSGRERFDVEFRAPGTPPVDPCQVFAERVPFRFEIDDDFATVLDRVRTEWDRVARRQTYPRDLVPRSPTLRSQAGLLATNKLSVAVELGCVGSVADRGYDLVLQVPLDGRDGLVMFDAARRGGLETCAERLSLFLENLACREGEPLRAVPFVSRAERQTLLGAWRSTGEADRSKECLHDLVESQAARTPAAVALRCGAVELTYRELDARAEQLAGRLRRLGVRPEVAVGLCVERSPEAIVGMLGILKAGGAYVPLDPAYPSNRLAFIVGDSGMRAVVTTRGLAGRLPAGPMPRVYLDADEPADAVDASADPVAVEHRNLAYVIYTSGSSGTPKGVMVEHRSVVNFVRAAQSRYALRSTDRVLQFASMNFDASVEEIFPCLASGATLVLRTDDMLSSARVFMEHCAEWGITVLDLPTAYWHVLVTQMQEGGLSPHPELRLVIIGGEAASPPDVAAWRAMVGRRIELVNTYGPTEATVVSTWADLNACAACDEAPIGVPIPGATACVLDPWGQLVPAGVVGELHVGGAGLARGYRNRPELTAEKFVPDPHDAVPGGRLYRTGDLCSWRPDGMLVFHGRLDAQVKVRGHRIELGEIEAALAGVPEVRQAAVIAHEVKPGDTRLVAYYVGIAGGGAEDAIRDHVARVLPEFMVPTAFVRVESLPLNPSGKIDRKALPAPHLQRSLPAPCVLPRTPLEQRLAVAWCEVLGDGSVGVHDDFFHSGGDSLLAMEFVAAIRDACGVEVPLSRLFERRTIAGLATFIAASTVDGEGASAPPAVSVAHTGPSSLAADGALALPASGSQQGMWLLRSLCADPATYNESFVFRTRAAVDWQRLRQALATIMAGQPALRTALVLGDRGVVQRIEPAGCVALPWAERTLSVDRGVDREGAIGAFLREEARRPFELSIAPLWRATLVRLVDGESLLQLAFHHAIIDDWSTRLLVDWLAEGAATAAPTGVGPVVATIAAGVVATPPLAEPEAARHRDFWAAALRDPPDGPRWPADHARPSVPTGRGDVLAFDVDADTARRLRGLAHENDVTLFVLMLAAWHAWLHLASGEDDIVVGTPVADRVRPETQRALGCFLNTLPIRVRWRDVGGDRPADARPAGPSFREVVGAVRDTFHAALAHVELPFEQIVGTASESRAGNVQPLVRVLFAFLDRPLPALRLDGVSLPLVPVHTGTSKCDLTLFIVAEAGAFRCRLEYATDVFDAATIGAHAARFVAFLRAAAAAPSTPLHELTWLPAEERRLVAAEWPRGADLPVAAAGLHDLFAAHVERTPDEIALAWEGGAWSYAELWSRAARLAARLRDLGVSRDVPVGVAARRSPEAFLAVLAILEAGGCYVPFDPSWPAARLEFVVDDSACAVVLVDGLSRQMIHDALAAVVGPASAAGGREPVVLSLEEESAGGTPVAAPQARPTADPAQLAYVLYTSGSTGMPKGVAMPHGPLVNLLTWQASRSGLGPGDRTLQFASLGFDVSCQEMFSTWLSGGTLVLVPDEVRLDPSALLAAVERQGMARLFLPVVMLEHLAEAGNACRVHPRSLREVIVAGEQLRITPSIRQFFAGLPCCRLWNHYGPTETHVATAHLLPAEPASWPDLPPIGRPIANTLTFLLDQRMQPVPRGVAGDLWIGGAAVARGYWRRPELTAERFVPDPFAVDPACRLYRTGDRGRWRADGGIDFLGRSDHQVKIRGHRVELGEIEVTIGGHPAVKMAAAVACGVAPAGPRVAAFVVAREPGGVQPDEIVAWLETRLPEPMVPASVTVVPALPMNASGKVDRRALEIAAAAGTDPGGATVADGVALGPVEEVLADVWRQLLQLRRVAPRDDFFRVGGSSLLAMRLVVAIEARCGVRLPVRAVFEHPSLAGLARVIEAAVGIPGDASRQGAAADAVGAAARGLAAESRAPGGRPAGAAERRIVPASSGQRRLWFLEQYAAGSSAYVIPLLHRIRGPLDIAILRASLDRLVTRHESLRTSFVLSSVQARGELEQIVAATGSWPVTLIDAGGVSPADREAAARRLLAEECRRPFDLARGPLVRGAVVRLDADDHLLLLELHHIVGDGWSVDVLHRELAVCYAALQAGREPALPALGMPAADVALLERATLEQPDSLAQEAFWRRTLAGAPRYVDLPTDFFRSPVGTFQGGVARRILDDSAAERIASLGHDHQCTPLVVVAGGLAALLGRWCGAETIVLGIPVANRPRPEMADLVGFLVNSLPLRIDMAGQPSFSELLVRVRRLVVDAIENAAVPFDRIVELAGGRRDPSRAPVFQVMCSWQDELQSPLLLPGLEVQPADIEVGWSRFDLTLVAARTRRGLELRLEYATDLFSPATADRLLGWLACLLEAAAAAPETPVAALPIDVPEERAAPAGHGHGPVVPLPQPTCLVDLFRAQARRTPTAVAVACADREVSYAELDAASDRLAARLVSRPSAASVEPGGFIGILLDRSIEFVVAVLGVLKAGAGYAPLPADQPAERLAFMVADARLPAVVTCRHLAGRLPADGAELVLVDADEPWWQRDAGAAECGPPPGPGDGESPAYVMYTSGSTGMPKGVVVPHRAVVRLVHGQTYAAFGPELRTLLLAPTAFDASTFELWAPLLGGGTCVVFPDPIPELPRLAAVLRAGRVNCLWLTAGLFNHVIDAAPEVLATVVHVITGGEALSIPHVRRALAALPGLRLTNGYGPTEATTFATTHEIGRDDTFPGGTVPIGRPLANTSCFVVDAEMRPLPSGRPGELVIGGPGLALGYLGWPELTAAAFIPDPSGAAAGDRLYRTGDLCRWRSDGELEFLGRIDDQVKIRGHRVEPGEIRAVLERHPDVEKAAVVVREQEMADGSVWRILRGCVVPRAGAAVDARGLRAFLAGRLPEPMLPGEWVVRADLPLSPNGKVDRAALLALPADVVRGLGDVAAETCTADETRLGTLLEAEIMGIWRRLFGRDDIHRGDDFFAIGGHSLLAARLAIELERLLGHPVAIASLFQAPTVESQARLIADASWAPPWKALVPIAPAGDRPPLFLVHGVGGDVFHFVSLAKLLPADQPVYGLQSIGRGAAAPATLAELAAEYAAEIRSLAPRGPYRVGGYSLGGWVAFEVARLLRAEGDDVMLLLFDVHANCAAPWPARAAKHLAVSILELGTVARRTRLHVGRLREQPVGGRGRAALALLRPLVRRLARAAGWSTFDQAAAERAAAARGTPLARPDPLFPLVARHVPAAFDGQIELFRASSWSSATLPLFWRLLVGRRVRVHRLPCGHHDIFTPEQVRTLAAAVTAAIATPGRGAAPASRPNPGGRHA